MSIAELSPEQPAWFDRALCRRWGIPTSWFFPEVGVQIPDKARTVCHLCDVRAECLAFGLRERHGMYGGRTPKERQMIVLNAGKGDIPPLYVHQFEEIMVDALLRIDDDDESGAQ